MYSPEISDLFKKLGINIGDSILVSNESVKFEGILMPRPDIGNNNIIVIKRKDGYNVGIRYSGGTKVEKLESRTNEILLPKLHAQANESLKTIHMLYTGGTIGSKVDYITGGVHVLTNPGELLFEVPELQNIANINVKDIMHTFSEDMSHNEWSAIASEVFKSILDGADGVIITHGTDTMHYTAAALSFMIGGLNKPVVLTGAQRSSDRGSSDAFMNLICSAYVAQSDIAEVMICMHEDSSDKNCIAIRGTKARKMHTSRRDAFKPINNLPIARISYTGSIEKLSKYKKANVDGELKLLNKFESRTALIKAYPNSDPSIIDYYVKKGCKGIILEGTGLGHLPIETKSKGYSWLSHVKDAITSGVVVGITSQCIYGRVDYKVYSAGRLLHESGAVYCEDMTPEVAYVKLGVLLGNYDSNKAKNMLNVDISGEITERSEFDF
jgi:glutamyl-tRNA(Gln) amidotransferase subunit D